MTARRHDVPVFQPVAEPLEAKVLMTIDLGGTSPPALPFSATAPFGVDLGASTANGGAGFSVADVGDLTGSGYDDMLIGAPTVTSPSDLGQRYRQRLPGPWLGDGYRVEPGGRAELAQHD